MSDEHAELLQQIASHPDFAKLVASQVSMPEAPTVAAPPVDNFKPSYPAESVGLGTPAVGAFLQMIDPMGKNSAQLDRDAAMRGPLLRRGHELNPTPVTSPTNPAPFSEKAQQHWLGEDLNSVMLKYQNWRKRGVGEELSPQEHIVEDFVDVRNPNSYF